MTEDGRVDLPSCARLLAHFEASGCKGAVLAGTNGEGPSLSAVEKRDLLRAMSPVRGQLELILGVATGSLDEAIWLCRQAYRDGAAAALVMPPSYFREAAAEGIARWFEELMAASDLPIVVYNFPQRTGVKLAPELVRRLASHDRFLGLKDSSGEIDNLTAFRSAVDERHVLYVGNETLLMLAVGAGWTGTISGASNSVGEWLVRVLEELEGDPESARAKFSLVLPVIELLRELPQPAVHKAVLQYKGVIESSAVKLPLLAAHQAVVDKALEALGMLGV